MTRFFIAALFATLAVQCVQAIDMGRCAQQAVAKGVPELGIPPHDPLVVSKEFSFHFDSLMGSEFTFKLSNLTWTNLAWWEVRKNTVTKNTTEYFDVEGEFWWDNFTISFDYLYQWGSQKLEGDVILTYDDITWKGSYEETVPDSQGIRKLNYLKIEQKVGKRSIKTDGFGLLGPIADNLLLAANDIVNSLLINTNNFFGTAFAYKINSVWYGNLTVYNNLVKWCESQQVPMHLY